jgi:hypothetical protein
MPTFTLEGADADFFTIDAATGALGLQDWFVPAGGDVWDADDDGVYVVSVTEEDDAGGITTTDLELSVTGDAASGFTIDGAEPREFVDDAAGEDEPEPEEVVEEEVEPETEADLVVEPEAEQEPEYEPEPEPEAEQEPEYEPEQEPVTDIADQFFLSGEDAEIFTINPVNGDLGVKPWFAPVDGDFWDADDDGVYSVTVTTIVEGDIAIADDRSLAITGSVETGLLLKTRSSPSILLTRWIL